MNDTSHARLFTTLVDTDTLGERLDDERWVVVDCRYDLADTGRGERVYAESHIRGAFYLHLERDLSGAKNGRNGRHPLPDMNTLASTLSSLGIGDETQVVAYDEGGGMWAARLWWLLRALGHEAVAVLDGGFAKWTRENRPVDAAMPRARPARLTPRATPHIAEADEILRALDTPPMLVIDARAGERFRGENEPIDAVAGHIPGARNRPHAANLAAAGTFKDAATLRAEFTALLRDRSPSAVVHQCGSGVTACHNILAMEIAGLPGSRLYPGSWSEWCSDPRRPVARGA